MAIGNAPAADGQTTYQPYIKQRPTNLLSRSTAIPRPTGSTSTPPTLQRDTQPNTTSFASRTALPSGQGMSQMEERMATQRSLAGPALGQILPGGRPLLTGDVPLLEAGLNFENMQLAELDRTRAEQELRAAQQQIGADPQAQLLRQLAMQRLLGQGSLQEAGAGAIMGRGAVAGQDAMMAAQQQSALQGRMTSPEQMAGLAQQRGLGVSEQLAQFGLARDEAEGAALQQVFEMQQQDELRRQALSEMLANLFAGTERAPIDLSGLITKPKGASSRQVVFALD